jgi:hypothetical protein
LIRANFYHVRGSEADLIVDTGTGIVPLGRVLGGLVDAARQVIAVGYRRDDVPDRLRCGSDATW